MTEEINDIVKNYLTTNYPKYLYNKNFVPGKSQVLYSGPYWDEKEILAMINTILNGKWFVAGENVYKFEREFAKRFGVEYSHMVNSGSSANLVMMAALKKYFQWEDGSEIIVSPVGFPTTISAIVQNNMIPVFIDIEFDTLNFNINKIEEKITDKTKGIFVSPVLGNPPDMDFLKSLCEKHNIKLIGDSCDSIGTKWNDKDLSDFYVAWTSSFYPAHHISTGEGGMISSNIEELKKLFMSFATWGRSCMKFDGAIYTTSGIKNICDIVVGDLVYTHLGNYKMVNELITRKYTGKMYKFKSKKNIDVEFTSEHPLYIERNGLYSWIESKNIIVGDNLVQKIPQQIETPKTFTINYDTLFKNVSFDINVEDDLFRLVGYWLAEGSLAKGNKGSNGKILPSSKGKYLSYRVDFSFHKDETLYIDDVILLMKKYFNVAGWVRKDNGNGVSVEFKSRKGYEFFQKFCNKISYNKKINHNFIHYDKSLLKELIKGFWRGDGSSSKSNFSLSTTSPHLFQQFKLILSRFGINPRVNIRKPENHSNCVVNGRNIIAKHDLYTLSMSGDNCIIFSKIVDEICPIVNPVKTDKIFSDDSEYMFIKIEDIIVDDVIDIDVYNFEVDDDHSYHANGISSHNCYCIGSANLLSCGTCGNRFDRWLDNYDGIIDHKYVFTNMGYNLKPLDLQGSIGLEQLKKFDEIDQKRKASKSRIEKIITENVKGVKGVLSLEKSDTCWFGTPFICESKELKQKLVTFLEENKIQTRNYFAGNILLHEGYKHLDDYNKYPESNKVLDFVFFLGAAPHYDEVVFEYIENIFKEKWTN